MNDLDRRLRNLASSTDKPGSNSLIDQAATLRLRAADRHRRRQRRRFVLAAASAAVLAAGATLAVTHDDPAVNVATAPETDDAPSTPTTADEPVDGTSSVSNVEGVTINVSPSTGLVDGQVVDVHIEGLDLLESPMLVMCAGDVDASTAMSDCDYSGLDRAGVADSPRPWSVVDANETVTVRRTIGVTRASPDPNEAAAFDCATEPVGCVIALGSSTTPTVAAFAPIEFDPDATVATAELHVNPSVDLQSNQEITVSATGLRPNSTYYLQQCSSDAHDSCDVLNPLTASSDTQGALTVTTTAAAAIYSWQGRTDCTSTPCVIAVTDHRVEPSTAAISFADGVTAPVPTLSVAPGGPYQHRQEVTLTGQGFPPGLEIGRQIGQCPDGLDTASEERCVYPAIGRATVAEDGTFSVTLQIYESLIFTGPCAGDTGCHLGWVIPLGPTVATAPLEFR